MRQWTKSDGTVCVEYDAGEGSIEYGGSGFISSIGGLPSDFKGDQDRSASRRLTGYATRWNKPHAYKGKIDVFAPGCFDVSLAAKRLVRFCEEHEPNITFATTNGGGLELRSDDVGLAFLADCSGETGARAFDLVKSHRKRAMSVKYYVTDHSDVTIAGESVRLIKAATLDDIALCSAGCVKEAYADVADGKSAEPAHASKRAADINAAAARWQQINRALIDHLERG